MHVPGFANSVKILENSNNTLSTKDSVKFLSPIGAPNTSKLWVKFSFTFGMGHGVGSDNGIHSHFVELT